MHLLQLHRLEHLLYLELSVLLGQYGLLDLEVVLLYCLGCLRRLPQLLVTCWSHLLTPLTLQLLSCL